MNTHVYRNFLILQISLFVIFPFFSVSAWANLVELMLGMSLLSIGLRLTVRKREFKSTLLPFLLVLSLWIAELVFENLQELRAIRLTLFILFFIRILWFVSYQVFIDHKIPIADRLLGTISIYLLIMALFGYFYSFILLINPHAILCNSTLCQDQNLMFSRDGDGLYFSSVILTTLGFGDLIPGTPVVAMMASIEALLGQMYVAVAIARIVGLRSLDVAQSKDPDS